MPFTPEPRPHANTPLTLEERREIKKWLCRGKSCSMIARAINRGKNTITVEIRRNGGKASYDPVRAQERANRALEEANTKRSKALSKYAPINPLRKALDRIEALEMHVSIIIEELRNLRRDHN